MATAYVTYAPVEAVAAGNAAAVSGFPARSEIITTSGTSAQGALSVKGTDIITVFCATTVVAVVGPNATASLATGIVCPAGIPKDIEGRDGDKVALIDA